MVGCLVPRPRYSAPPKCFGSRVPSKNLRPRQKSSKLRQLKRWFTRPVFRMSRLKPLKDTEMGRESSKECSAFFLWTKEGFSWQNYSSRPIGGIGLFLNATYPEIRRYYYYYYFFFFASLLLWLEREKNNAWYIYLTSSQPPPNLHNLTSAWPVMLLANQRLPEGNQILAGIMSLSK